MPTSILMHGAAGRMGQRILSLAAEAPDDYVIAGGVDKQTGTLRDVGVACDAPLSDTAPVAAGTVVIDFSHASVTPTLIEHCRANAMPMVIGTTGVGLDEQRALIDQAKTDIPILWAPNMAIGVNVVFQIAAQIAKTLGLDYDIEVIEAHHHHKVDAPSGTAYGITDAICEATGRSRSDLVHGREGHTGARQRGEIGVHALRMGDVVGDHSAYFVGNGERVVLSHVAHTRDIFARGALRAAAFVGAQQPGAYTMKDVLGL